MTNVVVIIADQLRADHLGFVAQVPVRTPHIDGLAARGAVFDHAHVTNPVCMPNRASIITGRWPSAHGLRTNGLPLDPRSETFIRTLRAAGYRTAAVGKLHHQPMGYPFEEYQLEQIKDAVPDLWAAAVEGPFGSNFESLEDFQRHAREDVHIPEDYYGFDDVSLVSGHGDRVSGNYLRWAEERGFNPLEQAGWKNAKSSFPDWREVYESATPAALHPTTFVAEQAIERLQRYAQSEEPFCLFVSFPDPHHPFAPPAGYFNRYRPEDVPLPPSFFDNHASSPQYLQEISARRGQTDIDPMMLWAPTEDQFRHALAAELGSIEFIDDSVGTVLDTLDELGLRDDTVVIFTSDHGDAFGDNGYMLKHFAHYRGITKVPLIVTGQGIAPSRQEALVSSADIAPTVLDLLGAPALPRAQGQSLAPLLLRGTAVEREVLLVEEDQPFGLEGLPGPIRMRTVITDRFRFTVLAGTGISELYDLNADPDELLNLAQDPAHRDLLAEAHATMLEAILATLDSSTIPIHAA